MHQDIVHCARRFCLEVHHTSVMATKSGVMGRHMDVCLLVQMNHAEQGNVEDQHDHSELAPSMRDFDDMPANWRLLKIAKPGHEDSDSESSFMQTAWPKLNAF